MKKSFLTKIFIIVLLSIAIAIGAYYYTSSKIQNQLNKELISSYISLANFYASKNDNLAAIENYDKALALDADNDEAMLGYGKESLKEGKIQPIYFKKILEKNPKNKEANFYMGIISLDRPETATSYLEISEDFDIKKKEIILNFLKNWPSEFNSILYKRVLIAQIDIAIGENNLAINLLQSVVEEMPNYRDAWILLGQAHLGQNKKNKALESFEKALALDGDNREIKNQILNLKNIE